MRLALSSVALALAFAGCLYLPNSYSFQTEPFVGKRVPLPCLDLAVAMTDDASATSPVVRYSFGNRCTHSAIVDLSAVRAVGIDADGQRVPMRAFDPHHEIRPLSIDAWWRGSENIMYTTTDGSPTPVAVCVDVAGVEPPARGEQWVCVGAVEL